METFCALVLENADIMNIKYFVELQDKKHKTTKHGSVNYNINV